MMNRYIIPALVMAGAWLSPASAATPKTVQVSAQVASACSISAAQPSVSVSRSPSTGILFTPPSPAVTVSCNKANGTLSVRSSQLSLTSNPTTKRDYTLRVQGWSVDIDYSTSSTNPPAQTASGGPAGTVSLTFGCQVGCNTSNINNNSTYTALLTLGISASP